MKYYEVNLMSNQTILISAFNKKDVNFRLEFEQGIRSSEISNIQESKINFVFVNEMSDNSKCIKYLNSYIIEFKIKYKSSEEKIYTGIISSIEEEYLRDKLDCDKFGGIEIKRLGIKPSSITKVFF